MIIIGRLPTKQTLYYSHKYPNPGLYRIAGAGAGERAGAGKPRKRLILVNLYWCL